MVKTAPIALFVYNRLSHTEQTIQALNRNYLSSDSDLYIFSDAPKEDTDHHSVSQVRNYIHSITGFKSIHIIERTHNMGLANSIIDGVTTIVNRYGRVIVLEDDLVTNAYFLQYMNDGLEMYENESKVASIHGYIYPLQNAHELPDTFFIRGADCWGWATWKRAWDVFEADGELLLTKLNENEKLRYLFNFNDTENYILMLEQQILGINNSWAVRWYASTFLEGMKTLYPARTLIKNIGLDNTGTHCGQTGKFNSEYWENYTGLHKISICESREAREKIQLFFRPKRKKILEKILFKLKQKFLKHKIR